MNILDKYDKFDSILKKTVISLLILVISTQVFLVFKPFCINLSIVEKLEGDKAILQNNINPAGEISSGDCYITFRIISPYIKSLPEAIIFVNQEELGNFKNMQCTVKVRKDDNICIDATKYSLDLEIKAVPSKGIIIPKENILIGKGKQYSFIVK